MAPRIKNAFVRDGDCMIWEASGGSNSVSATDAASRSAASEAESIQASSPKKIDKSVRFAQTIEIHHLQHLGTSIPANLASVEPSSEKWIPQQDLEKFREDVRLDVQRIVLSRNCRSSSDISSSKEDDDLCSFGLEHLLSRDDCNELISRRLETINAVLDEQERQDDLGMWDPQAISFVSFRYSKWARERAQELGEIHYKER
mmetsp:Transcript_5692/g.11773  ORF Transcript_5692/g.11773 Transcript_5692/m.11773 type:complete len:202 (-) Transcript_5692:251-856(-)|eukprot:CAMPEP_0171346658 /NCGR_PEP_ID=MMETSP0878-20121228/25524_1 /TAXON_ID=67004 /ORGANISM="Thalassiosira weissflogii, Strain CCMP1336" /LENGTH=201 /DNA_ID=CAMNT_0011850411 /DNA_START=64 /DNA_END=669 /DNA_ORIENTATION=-